MAGSPGAGKTEYSKNYVAKINKEFQKIKIEKNDIGEKLFDDLKINNYENFLLRLDVDEIREVIPGYEKTNEKEGVKGNAHLIQKAANLALDILRKYCIEKQVSFLLDGTFGNQFSTFEKIIKRLIRQNRNITIFYIFIDPISAWEFTKAREYVEGRNIKKENFIQQFFKSMDNIKRAKEKFADKLKINFILKDRENNIKKIFYNTDYRTIENILKKEYNIDKLSEEYLLSNLK